MTLIHGNRKTPAILVAIAAAALAAGCGGLRSPEQVVRAWSEALNRGDVDAAAALFAPNAKTVAGDSIRILHTRKQAVAYNAEIRWCGPIVKLAARGGDVMAMFALHQRAAGRCDGRGGEHGSVYFEIRDGKIVLFDLVGA